MKLLITGGLGFIGSNFIRHHLAQCPNDEILNLDKITYAGHLENLEDIASHPQYHFEKGDIADAKLVHQVISDFRPQRIINFAAESHVDRSLLDSEDFIRTNVMGTRSLLEVAHETGCELFLQISTDEVYGSLGPNGYFTETTPLNPRNPYSASKASADLLCLSYFNTYQLPVIISRCSNNYGPYQFPEKLIPLAILNALQDKPIPVYGDGQNVRDWIHVEDHCRAIEVILAKGNTGEIYNIGDENEHSNLELVKSILHTLEKPETLIQFVKDRRGHDRRYATDPKKLKYLGWNSRVTFANGLQETVRWYQENLQWVAQVTQQGYEEYLKVQYGKSRK